jgi:hypothetical protein
MLAIVAFVRTPYQPELARDAELRRRGKLAEERRRFGCRRLHVLLKREGLVINYNLSLSVMHWMHGPMSVE